MFQQPWVMSLKKWFKCRNKVDCKFCVLPQIQLKQTPWSGFLSLSRIIGNESCSAFHCSVFLRQVYLSKKLNPRNKILIPCRLNKPNPKCYVCSEKREVSVKVSQQFLSRPIILSEKIVGDQLFTFWGCRALWIRISNTAMVSLLASWPCCPRFDSRHSQKNFKGKNCQCCWG